MIIKRALLGGSVVALLLAGCSGSPQPVVSTTAPPVSSAAPSSAAASPSPTPSETLSTTAAPSSSAGLAACTLGDLAVGLDDAAGGGAAGSTYVLLTFTNRSSKACSLYGYPGVSYVGKGNGTQIGAAAKRDGRAKKLVSIDPSKRTTAVLRIVQAGNYGDTCRATKTDGFRVFPPGSRTSAFVRSAGTGCANASIDILETSPVGTSS